MKRMPAVLSALALSVACSAYAVDVVTDRGTWPKNWPSEREPSRARARTVRGGSGSIPGQSTPRVSWFGMNHIDAFVDGDVVDRNHIPLPAETPMIGERFQGGPERSSDRSAEGQGVGGKRIEVSGHPRPKIGEPAPAIEAVHPDGNGLAIDDLAGKVVLVVFWRLGEDKGKGKGLPFGRLAPLRRAYADRPNFLILTVCANGGDRWEEWAALIAEQGEVDYGDGRRRFLDDPRWWNVSEYTEKVSPSKAYGATGVVPEYHVIGATARWRRSTWLQTI